MKNVLSISVMLLAFTIASCGFERSSEINQEKDSLSTKSNKSIAKTREGENMDKPVIKSEEEWKKELTPEQYRVLREKGTERAFTGKYDHHFEKGVYKCAACGNVLFSSDNKYDSGCGWPSYWTPLAKDNIVINEDRSFGMIRTEV